MHRFGYQSEPKTTPCPSCEVDVYADELHYYDRVGPEHCIHCAPATCASCRMVRDRFAGLPARP